MQKMAAAPDSTSKIIKPLRGGQITIPASFREKLGIGPDTLLRVTLEDGGLRIKPVKVAEPTPGSAWVKELYELFAAVREEAARYSEKGINADIDQAIQAVRKRDA